MSSSLAPIAQSVERLHGKEKVCGSIPHWGSDDLVNHHPVVILFIAAV
ncbi:MAG: hypothetical protein JWL99_3546 [Streptomyces oryziradicis]|nr:hypothetical protein [Actinacidiphila oryziradicis]